MVFNQVNIKFFVAETCCLVAASLTDYRKSKGTRRCDTYHITKKGLQYLLMVDEMNRSVPGVHI